MSCKRCVFVAYFLVFVLCFRCDAQTENDRVAKLLQNENYTVTFGTTSSIETSAELEIGHGSGHSGLLRWLRFRPGKENVEILSIEFDFGRLKYTSKWPADRAQVVVTSAQIAKEDYAALLHDLASVESAKLKPVEPLTSGGTSRSFWVNARLSTFDRTIFSFDWAGYDGDSSELEFAKPNAAVNLSCEVVKLLNFKDHELTEMDRAWASEKFSRDWKNFEGLDFHWWVRERYIATIGIVGDKAVLPDLGEILAAVPPKGMPREASNGRCIYYAINAITRLAKQDVRDKPIEEMDIEKTRLKVLELINYTK